MARKKRARQEEEEEQETKKKRRRSSQEDTELNGQTQKTRLYSWDDEHGTQRGLAVVFLFAVAVLSFLAFIEAAGDLGTWIDTFLGWLFGWGRFAIPLLAAALGYTLLHPEKYEVKAVNYIGLILFLLAGLGLLHLFIPLADSFDAPKEGLGGGYLGIILGLTLLNIAGIWAAIVILIALFIASILLMFRWSLPVFLERLQTFGVLGSAPARLARRLHAWRNGYSISGGGTSEDDIEDESDEMETLETVEADPNDPSFTSKEIEEATQKANIAEEDLEQMEFVPKKRKLHKKIDIPLELLSNRQEKPTSGDIEASKEKIRSTLESFGIDVEMGEVSVGPMVSQYTLKPAEGVKLTQITTLHNDISLALAAHPIRIEAPIPGKSFVGIEVPNKATAVVTLKDMLTAKGFKKRKDNLTLALGKDVAGKAQFASIQKMPHLLIAGATGSGKSVCINSIILTLLFQNSADDLKFIMIDPKRVELSIYNGIPHLLTPVVTDVEKTVNALKWAVNEMDRRYELLSRAGKRNIEAYNLAVPEEERMPYIVFIIDELADLMSVAASSVEAAIVRLAQMSRAIGIHLVLATQRPSVNVITGLIKANMPARIAFSVTSLVDSRTILDFSGAEKLLGNGDMLYMDATTSKPRRYQGAFVEDKEIENIVGYLREKGDPEYDSDITESVNAHGSGGTYGGDDSGDELLGEAKDVILQAGKASASLLQRRLRVGYARAARILDILEEQGFIGPAEGSKPREILVDAEQAVAEQQAAKRKSAFGQQAAAAAASAGFITSAAEEEDVPEEDEAAPEEEDVPEEEDDTEQDDEPVSTETDMTSDDEDEDDEVPELTATDDSEETDSKTNEYI